MKNLTQHVFGTLVLSLLVVCIALGGGYQLNEQGARAVGMGGAFVARASDPSAIYFNPAGLTSLSGINVLAGLNLILPSTTFTGSGLILPVETKTNSQVFTPINVYGTYQVNDQIVVGLGIFNPFGLGTEWPTQWGKAVPALGGAYVGSKTLIKSNVSTWYFNPSIGYKVNEDLSLGLGISLVLGSATLNNSSMSLDGTASGFNANIGAIYKIMPGLSAGLSYRMETDLKFSGNASVPAAGIVSKPGDAKLEMPGNLQIGVAYDVMPELTVEGDFQYVQWSTYKNLVLDLPAPVGTQVQAKNWDDGFIIRVGGEYKYDPNITLRAGLIEDISPQPPSKTEPMLPDGDRTDICIGGSYKIDANFSVDVSYMLVLFAKRTVTPAQQILSGEYKSTAHVISVNVGYAF